MKKRQRVIILSLVLAFISLLFSSCSKKDKGVYEFEKTFQQKLGENIVAEKLYDSREGIHFDGEFLYRFSFTEESSAEFTTKLETDSTWNHLPLSEELSLIMYGGEKDGIDYGYFLAERVSLPKITNGYWKFINEHNESSLFDGYSFDFALAIFDSNNNVMYYFEFHT